ncbi:hypothetical protein [uncultured Clostridium sp.]|jgi:hypothetical protein|uniref:hypothetical protein n=1 Tax=uncultured Clostridium sp. TaxID=59620 RepID=UPI0026156467|nr:hypothetical protein [uncultured Clostridium sp.]
MKKIIIGVLALAVVGVGGFFVSNKMAEAIDAPNDQKMTFNAKINPIEIYNKSTSTISIKINTGEIQANSGPSLKSIENSLEVDPIDGMELISANIRYKNFKSDRWAEKNALVKNNIIELGEIEYIHTGDVTPQDLRLVGPEYYIDLKYKVDNAKDFDFNGKVKLNYNTLAYGSNVSTKRSVGLSTEFKINIANLYYEGGSVLGERQEPLTVGLGREFTLKHSINPGVISKVVDEVIEPASTLNNEKRNLIYVVDKSVIDIQGGNEENARESIKKSLEEITASNSTASLVVYGEEAEIIKIDDKEVFSISELSSLIDKIESSDKSGNLGEAIRKAQIVSNNSESEDSIIIVSAENPNYYTQVSEGNTTMLSTIIEKDGFVVEDEVLAEEYVNQVINEVIINEESNTRWYGINYGIASEEMVLNDAIKRLEGIIPDIKKPYYDDFSRINSKAINPISIKATLNVTSKNDGIKIHTEDVSREIELEYDEKLQPVEQFITTRVKIIDLKGADPLGFDMSDPKNIEVKLIVEYNGETIEVLFNNPKDFEEGEDLLTWWYNAEAPYVVNTGLYNGRKQLPGRPKDIEDDIQDVQWASSHLLDELSVAELAVGNDFGAGMIIKLPVKSENANTITIKPVLDTKDIVGISNPDFKLGITTLYDISNKEVKQIDTGKDSYTLEAGKTYLLTIDQYIPEFIDTIKTQSLIGQSFKIGINIDSGTPKENISEDVNSVTNEGDLEKTIDFWGIDVQCVDKPEHF